MIRRRTSEISTDLEYLVTKIIIRSEIMRNLVEYLGEDMPMKVGSDKS